MQGNFKESLTYQDKIGNQISECLRAFNENNVDSMHASVDALLIMTPIRLYDQPFSEQLLTLDERWAAEIKLENRIYRKKKQAASGGCPDVLAKPSMQPDRVYWERKFVMLINLFDRRGIGLKLEKTETM